MGEADQAPATTPDASIRLRGVSKRFDGQAAPAVTDLSLDISSGEIVVLVGPSGCGKTTTLRMINRLVEPTSGSIEVMGRDQRVLPAHELRRSIGYVIQQVGLFPHRSVARNIGVVPELLGWPKSRIADRVEELTSLVGLDVELLDRYPAELSGGQQQRVGVARALAADPPVLLMDEPYSAVDPVVRARLQDELLELQATVGKTIVLVTHDIDEAIKLGDRVAVLAVGGILEQYATPDELLREPASEFVARFLGEERGLRRLGLLRVRDVEMSYGPVVGPTAPASAGVAVASAHATSWVAVVDGDELLGWVPLDRLTRADERPVGELELQEFVAVVSPSSPLREALDVIIRSRTRRAAVVDGETYVGMVTIDALAGGLR